MSISPKPLLRSIDPHDTVRDAIAGFRARDAGRAQTPVNDDSARRRELDQRRIVVGVEVEAFSIQLPDFTIGRRISRPRPGLSEAGERFTADTSIGSEYISRPFTTTREAEFLLTSGLRKYLRHKFGGEPDECERRVPLLTGGWTNRSAGTHIHISTADHELTLEDAKSLAAQIHDVIPLLVAMGANSPVWGRRLTHDASTRVLRGGDVYFRPLPRGEVSLEKKEWCELRYSPGRKRKPPTLELRVLDSNIPDFVVACLAVVKAVALHWLDGGKATNPIDDADYAAVREAAAHEGMDAKLPWRGRLVPATVALDRFVWAHRAEIAALDLPDETWDVLRLIKQGYNGSRILREAVLAAKTEHAQTWQRRFAKRYVEALERLLSGNHIRDFADALAVGLPSTDGVWLGRRGWPRGG